MQVDEHRLQRALAQIREARPWPGATLSDLEQWVMHAPDRQLYRLNPYRYASQHGLGPGLAIELFLQAVRAELFELTWSLVCRGCGELVLNHRRLHEVDDHFFCGACARDRQTHLDEQVEVSFTVRSEVRHIRFHDRAALAPEEEIFDCRFSDNIRVRGVGQDLVGYIRDRQTVLRRMGPGEELTVDLTLEPGWIVGSPRMMITVEGEPTSELQEVSLELSGSEWRPRPSIRPGPARVHLRSAIEEPVNVLQYFTPIVTYFDYDPFLSGQQLLNNSTFRRHLRTEVVRPGSGLPVKDNSLLFIDLRGSTALYDTLGDEPAFRVVSEHFERLAREVTRWSGVVVKTMGDSVMASFSRPSDAVGAALGMSRALSAGAKGGDPLLDPKIGIHRGGCIVVNVSDHPDFFGQTVNLASRLQGQAGPGEICLSEAVFRDEEVARLLAPFGEVGAEEVVLKGVSEVTTLYRLTTEPEQR